MLRERNSLKKKNEKLNTMPRSYLPGDELKLRIPNIRRWAFSTVEG
jgi:hypothetical protein